MIHAHTPLAADASVVIPEPLRQLVGWEPGDALTLECDGDSILIRPREPSEADAPDR